MKIDKCPKCGSTEGIEFFAWEKVHRYVDFNRNSGIIEYWGSKFPKTGKCIDCGKRLYIAELEGGR